MSKLNILPVFIPFLGCPHKCIYCDQHSITGVNFEEFEAGINEQIEFYTKKNLKWDEIAFYGGSFNYLSENYRFFLYRKANELNLPIRISAYPIEIKKLVKEFKKNRVKTVELGIQSFSEKVLKENKRFYNRNDILESIEALISANIKVGIQLMVGMYSETLKDFQENLLYIKDIPFDYLRIYPTVILKNTALEKLTKNSSLTFTFSEIVVLSAAYVVSTYSNNKNIIRIGLHNQQGLTDKIVGGYFHPSFGDIVKTFIVFVYCKHFECKLTKNHPNFKGIIANNFQVIYDINGHFERICKKNFEVFFENNGRQLKRAIFEIAKEFCNKTNLRQG